MKFIVNSTLTCAFRISEIVKVQIVAHSANDGNFWYVLIKTPYVGEAKFETATSLEQAQALAAPILAALEA